MADPSTSTHSPAHETTRKPRTLVLCLDGVGDEYGNRNTNVTKLFSILRRDQEADQLCYYQEGVGKYIPPGATRPFRRWASKVADKAVAYYLDEHVIDAYKFLMQNYNVDDNVCLFGFSRGAYTARALAGMLHKVGLLSKDNIEKVSFAFKLYRKSGNDTQARSFKATYCRPVPIDFVGVWDTVSRVGAIVSRTLPFASVNTTIRVFRQALSLDEHRARFRPILYHRSVPGQLAPVSAFPNHLQSATDEKYRTDMKEVWFAGCHSDIGGGAARDTTEHALSNIPLRWMIEQIVDTDCPIMFDLAAFDRWSIPVAIATHQPRNGNDTESNQQDTRDVEQSMTDPLKRNLLWWFFETTPMSYTFQNPQDEWVTRWSINLGRGRLIPRKPMFHHSVKTRMDNSELRYKPRARYEKGSESYVS
ncbi:hypothetical protein BGW80DRAFT_1354174 [Lactifluus volemus]|nr:hypothetical protein BGW80DRAFT_1354174 [Lactifluus volemus]